MTDPKQKDLFEDLFDPLDDGGESLDEIENILKEVLTNNDISLEDIEFDSKFNEAIRKIFKDEFSELPSTLNNSNLNNYIKSTNYQRENNTMPKVGWNELEDGTKRCYNNAGQIHCDTGPAEIRSNGSELHYKNGKLHRDGGRPAMTTPGGTTKFAVDGKYHRNGGLPAICWGGGGREGRVNEWWTNGELKKVEYTDGTIRHFAPGLFDKGNIEFHPLHREDGPAVEYANGAVEYWINGTTYVSQQDWLNALNNLSNIKPTQNKEVSTENKEEMKMSNTKPSFGDMVKSNGVAAAYRVAATQSTKAIKSGLVQAMKAKGGDNSHVEAFSAFLDTELGESIISMALGVGLNYMPGVGQDTRVQRLAEEMRIGGMALGANTIIGEAVTYIVPALQQVINKLPEAETSAVRVNTNSEASGRLAEAMMEEVESEATAAPVLEMKKMKA